MTSKIKVDNINKVSDDSNIIKKCGTTTTIGSGASTQIFKGDTFSSFYFSQDGYSFCKDAYSLTFEPEPDWFSFDKDTHVMSINSETAA